MYGTRIATERERLGLTQAELADKVNVSQKSISKYERGDRQPNFETITKLANVFGVSIDYLLGREGAQSIPQSSDPDESLAKFMSDYDRLNDNGKAYIKDQMGYALSKEIFTEKDTDERKKAQI